MLNRFRKIICLLLSIVALAGCKEHVWEAVVDTPSFPFMCDISTGSKGLDDSIKTMLSFQWKGDYNRKLDYTYSPGLVLLYGEEKYCEGVNGGKLPYYVDREDYLEKHNLMFAERDEIIDKCSYFPYISKEVFSSQSNGLDVRCYNVSTLISIPDGTFKCENKDMVCFNKNGKWSFYEENFPAHDLYTFDRIEVLMGFMKNEGVDESQCDKIRSILLSYTGEGLQYKKYSPQDDVETELLEDFSDMGNIIKGNQPGSLTKYLYLNGYRKIFGRDLSEYEVIRMFMDDIDIQEFSNISLLPYSLIKEDVSDNQISVYTMLSITCELNNRHLGNLLKSRTLCLKVPSKDNWCFFSINDSNEEMVETIQVLLDGLLTEKEVRSIVMRAY